MRAKKKQKRETSVIGQQKLKHTQQSINGLKIKATINQKKDGCNVVLK